MTGTSTSTAAAPITSRAPVVLPGDEPPKAVETSAFCPSDDKPHCGQKEFADMVYVTGQHKFWLLPVSVAEALQECAEKLRSVASIEDKAARQAELDGRGLYKPFIPAEAKAFLNATDKARYEQLVSEVDALERQIEQDSEQFSDENYQNAQAAKLRALNDMHSGKRNDSYSPEYADYQRREREWQALGDEQRVKQRELAELRKRGLTAAQKEGLYVQADRIYSPRERAIKEALDRYWALAGRREEHHEVYDGLGAGETGTYQPLWQVLNAYRKAIATCQDKNDAYCSDVQIYIAQYNRLYDYELKPYMDLIIELANLGVAVPEFALCSGDPKVGIEAFDKYIVARQSLDTLRAQIRAKFIRFKSATAGYAAPPDTLFAEEMQKASDVNLLMMDLRKQAEANLARLKPYRILVWEAEDYAIKPLDSLAKDDIPLREFSLSSLGKTLSHISLNDLPFNPFDKKTWKKASKTSKLAALDQPSKDEQFSLYLKEQGAIEVSPEKRWFNEEGYFHPESFFVWLEIERGYQVKSLQSPASRELWAEGVRQMLFDESLIRKIMLFDSNYQAQYLRMVTQWYNPDLKAKVEAAPELSVSAGKGGKLALASAKLELSYTSWRGEVDLIDWKIPEPAKARPMLLHYRVDNGNCERPIQTIDLGRYFISCNVKAWGFAGASLSLARDLELSSEDGRLGISGVDFGQREGSVAELKLFAGAQAGCRISGALYWNPPAGVLMPPPLPGEQPKKGWRALAKLQAEVNGGVGLSGEADFRLGLVNGRLIFSAKASLFWGAGAKGGLSFAIDYESLADWLGLFRQALVNSNYRQLDWITPEAFNYLSKLSYICLTTLGDVAFFAARSIDDINALYSQLTGRGNGGYIAYTLTTSERRTDFKKWFEGLPPEAIGPLLLSLTEPPRTLNPDGTDESINPVRIRLMQQQAIELCISWMHDSARGVFSEKIPNNAQRQYEEAITRMNPNGKKTDENPEAAFCKGLFRLMDFMDANTGSYVPRHNLDRKQFNERIARLGMHVNHICKVGYRS
ncbi:conserved hypothetical protein [Pseudomonas sp. 8Z]|uniref:hypothetical protein n=1 Tax=Pseudomonas sp. 8Z TaxID=2653166 RepID=UPI0012EF12BA|nr:hypothetical protein [Pseudomonas sp. 8Z]VXC97248.1 conserved hypothetical protein [Pseudomonas sp. 8Z]